MGIPDIIVTTSLDAHNQMNLADRHIGKHKTVSYAVERKAEEEGTLYFASAFELLEFVLKNHDVLTLFMSSFAIAAGAKLPGLIGKVFEAGAGELGKDLYSWLKTAVQRAIHDCKDKDAHRPERDRLGELRVVIRGVILDRVRFFAYIYYRYDEIHSTRHLLDADAEVVKQTSEFFAFVLPFVTYLFSTSPELMDGRDPHAHMSANIDTPGKWGVALPQDLSFTILPSRQIVAKSVVENRTEEALIESRYRQFAGAMGTA